MLAEIWNVAQVFMSIFGFLVTLYLLRDVFKMRKMLKTWYPVLQEFEKRIPLISQLGTMWGTMQKNLQVKKKGVKPTKDQVRVRAKIVDDLGQTLPSSIPIVGTAIAQSLAKLSGNDKAILLTDSELLGSMLKIAGTVSKTVDGIGKLFGGGKQKQPQKRRGKTKLMAPPL